MTSTINSMSSVNGASGNPLSNSVPQNPSAAASDHNNSNNDSNNSRPAMRSSSTIKTSTDGNRRQAGSPVDGAQRYVVVSLSSVAGTDRAFLFHMPYAICHLSFPLCLGCRVTVLGRGRSEGGSDRR
ncbi:predicted protein [Histoplasma capsulatum G186AR]|uniref:Uncharacterized protein n=1 Tax=Ajellomyces capsulatus (strain G186AR / H82 / ATCC MYA-2454 / RMSCC 2432) TaxID=447093 RepID=C0NMS0_AJECG|nr:uncharacterized protein HCBG_04047 [Histoplasma capsulatum G186AR]EEH07168.1 predicted protein [Histoplasma capsulatum G186AR]